MSFQNCILPQLADELNIGEITKYSRTKFLRTTDRIKYPKLLPKRAYNIVKEYCEQAKIDISFYKYLEISMVEGYWQVDFYQNEQFDGHYISLHFIHYDGREGILVYKIDFIFQR